MVAAAPSVLRRYAAPFAAFALLGALLVGIAARPAGGIEFPVTNTNDSGAGSLRQAIADAETTAGDDVVVVQPGLGTITLTSGTIFYGVGALGTLTVQGNGVTVDANGASTAIDNDSLTLANLDGITFTGATGNAVNSTVGGLLITNSTFTGNDRAANTNSGALQILDSVITGNTGNFDMVNTNSGALVITRTQIVDNAGNAGNTASGEVTISRSVLSRNQNRGFNTATGNVTLIETELDENGGPGLNSGGGELTVIRSTISNHEYDGSGAGINSVGPVVLVNSTVSNNTAVDAGGGIDSDVGVTLVYSTVVDNAAPEGANIRADALTTFGSVIALPQGGGDNCFLFSPTTTNGFNYSDDALCGLSGTGDTENGANPQLGPLADNGGPLPTLTRAPALTSPLVDAIPVADCPFDGVTTDERTVARPQGPGCDIGAVELTVVTPPPPAGGGAPQPVAVRPRLTG